METLDRTALVGRLVAEQPSRSRVFERWGLDYCCGGKKPLADACAEKNVDIESVLLDLEALGGDALGAADLNWAHAPLGEMCERIVDTHHAYLRRELPRLAELIRKTRAAHANRHPELHELAAVFGEFKLEIDTHTEKEEQILFPFIKRLEASRSLPEFFCGTVAHPIARMEQEHTDAGVALVRMRTITNDFTPPGGACNTYLAMLDGLGELEADMHQHIHKENNILFPAALAREKELSRSL